MFSFQGACWVSKKLNEVSLSRNFSQFLFWWRLAGSNRWPPACKAGALPAELNPHIHFSFKRSGGPRTRFSAEKPRRLQHATGMLPSAAFRVHFGFTCLYVPVRRLLDSFLSLFLEVVGQNGLEPSTSRLSVVCSSQLSYWPVLTSSLLRYILSIPCKLNNALSHFRTLLLTLGRYK